jgi:hypothetical protein
MKTHLKIGYILSKLFYFNLLLLMLLCVSLDLFAQSSYIKDRLTLKIQYSRYPEYVISPEDKTTGNIKINVNYGILNHVELGGYIGYCKFNAHPEPRKQHQQLHTTNQKFTHAPGLGININYQFLPYLINAEDFRLDLYFSGNVGGFYRFSPENYIPVNAFILDYHVGVGFTVYLWKHIGLFAKYGHANYANFGYGVSYKF